MSQDEQVIHFGNELDRLINRFRDEYDISYAAVIGALHRRIHTLNLELDDFCKGGDENADSATET